MLAYLVFLLYQANSSATIENRINLAIGSNCGSSATYQVTSFIVSPWPISPGEVGEIIMTGTFHDTVHVDEIFILTTYNSESTSVNTIEVQQTFNAGTTKEFQFRNQFSNKQGSYLSKVELVTSTPISCWQFAYTLDD
ncbi:hypothetical protein SteCoe_13079 [Stentor coeruleus]|uniref:Reelin domain-containing protein n=1 Tax=Stentor coeruleus TaxID=5963 RepID=A0A1R2C9F3_9CILI|nr:hypothetical protein SteCoe_13079 [Stentor coeruleus]